MYVTISGRVLPGLPAAPLAVCRLLVQLCLAVTHENHLCTCVCLCGTVHSLPSLLPHHSLLRAPCSSRLLQLSLLKHSFHLSPWPHPPFAACPLATCVSHTSLTHPTLQSSLSCLPYCGFVTASCAPLRPAVPGCSSEAAAKDGGAAAGGAAGKLWDRSVLRGGGRRPCVRGVLCGTVSAEGVHLGAHYPASDVIKACQRVALRRLSAC